jgi:hypothetical protein
LYRTRRGGLFPAAAVLHRRYRAKWAEIG